MGFQSTFVLVGPAMNLDKETPDAVNDAESDMDED
jgi:hypothetical protein